MVRSCATRHPTSRDPTASKPGQLSDLSTVALGNRSQRPTNRSLRACDEYGQGKRHAFIPSHVPSIQIKVRFNTVMDTSSINSDERLAAWVEAKARNNRKLLTQDISVRHTMDEECLQNKLFGYLLDRYCVGWICFCELHARAV